MTWSTNEEGFFRRGHLEPAVRSYLDNLVESGEAAGTGGVYHIRHSVVAGLDDEAAHGIGLPPTLAFSLRMRSIGNLVRPDSELRIDWFHGGRPVYLDRRIGSLAIFGDGKHYRVPSPVYEVLEAVDRLNGSDLQGQDRLVLWAEVKRWVGGEALVDDEYLRQLTVHVASGFTVKPIIAANGDHDFEVLPGRWVTRSDDGAVAPEREFEAVLPSAYQQQFEARFRALSGRSAYPINAGTILLVTPEVGRAFREIREIRDSGPLAIRGFLRQPHAVLRLRLEGDESAGELLKCLDEVFEYSERVKGIGMWEPKVVPWVKKGASPWLPPESFGVFIDNKRLEIPKEDIAHLEAEIASAIVQGLAIVQYQGVEIPATAAVLETVRLLEGESRPPPHPDLREPSETSAGPRAPGARTVLLVEDNFDDAQFLKQKREVPRLNDVDVSRRIHSTLYRHQQAAVDWLIAAWLNGEPGVLLADDMGLGKTLEALAFMAWVRGLADTGQVLQRPILVVAPTGLLKNWVQEAEKHLVGEGLGDRVEAFGEGLRALRIGAKDTDTGEIGLDLARISQAGWVLTSYESYRDYQLSFGRVAWSLAVFDEVQKVKNPASAVTQAATSVNAEFVLSLTGTPVENRLADLWSIMDLTQPGLLGSLKTFSSTWETDGADLSGLRDILSTGAPPAMMRRLKEDHLDGLPKRQLVFARARMPEEQRCAYDEAVDRARSATGSATLEALGRIRSISLHPHARGTESLEDYVRRSARLHLTVEWLQAIQTKGEKALVFVESRAMQATVAEIALDILGLPHRPLLINGAVSGPARQRRVDLFQERDAGFDLMILSPKAGGVGLTLTAANHVIHLSRWWNPAVEDQCTDRVFRIGQERNVMVYHPISEHPSHRNHSFDIRLDELLRSKRRLSRAVLAPAGASPEDFDRLLRDVTEEPLAVKASMNLNDVDVLDGAGFEAWVGEELRKAGYQVNRTPTSWDSGVDLVAQAGGLPTLIVQCKHTQTGAALTKEAVEEVLRGVQKYVEGADAHAAVVTNSAQVSPAAKALAFATGVHLWSREDLVDLSDPKVFLGPTRR